MTGWDEFWRESGAEASFIGSSGTHPELVQYWTEFFAKQELVPSESRCIDIASGSGIVIQSASDYFGNRMPLYSGLDISDAAVQQLTARFPSVTGVVADATSIPLDSYSFELVTSNFGVEYAGRKGILEAARLVAVGGNLAFVLHCRPGVIYDECSTSLQVVDRVRQARLLTLANKMFRAGFAVARGAERHNYDRAVHKFKPAFRVLEKSISKYGEGVASGFVLRLHADLERISQNLQKYDSREVAVWLGQLDRELLAYRNRMKSMTDAAIAQRTLDRVGTELCAAGFTLIDVSPILDPVHSKQLAWSLQARRNSASS